jgi:hypothetical protein
MNARKVVTGSVLAAGLGVAGLLGAAPAFAGPGISVSIDGNDAIGLGDQNAGTGAFARSTKTNNALAINTGFSPVGSLAVAEGERNNVVSIDGIGVTGPSTKRNNVVTAFGSTTLGGDAHDNTIVNLGGIAYQNKPQGADPGVFNLSACGTEFSGQADHIKVSAGPICGGES